MSSTVKDLVAGSGIEFNDRGEHELKASRDGIQPLSRADTTECAGPAPYCQ